MNSSKTNNDLSTLSSKRFTLKGKVVNNVLDKTITVLVTNTFRHAIYQKKISSNKKYLAHDPKNQCQIGDYVLITVSRKLSKRKSFRLLKIITPVKAKEELGVSASKDS